MNLFELYKIPISFIPNKELVKKQYFLLSRKFHPDFVGNGTEDEQTEALEMSSMVNKAFKIFSNQDATIQYVLELKGLLESEEKYTLPNEFLMKMMELNESLMDAKMENNETALAEIINKISSIKADLYQSVSHVIESTEIAELNTSDFLKVKEYYFKKKYLNRILYY